MFYRWLMKSVLIFEDDVKFEPYIRDWMEMILREIKDNKMESVELKSSLLYFGILFYFGTSVYPFYFYLESLYDSPYSYIGGKRLHIDEEYKLDGL